MNPTNHFLIGKLVYEHVCSNKNIKLDKNSFLWGNMAPDFSRELTRKPHYSHFYLSAVQNAIQSMLNIKVLSDVKGNIDFSYGLGVICHFYADFFCHAHLPSFKKNLIKHIRYESMLCKSCKDNFELLSDIDYTKIANNFYNGVNLNEFYIKLIAEVDVKEDMLAELTRAVMACCWVTALVTEKATGNETDIAFGYTRIAV